MNRDPRKRPTKETYKRDLQKRPMWTKRDPYICVSNTWSDTFVHYVYEKRPTKETCKRGLCQRKETNTFMCQTLDLIYLCVMYTKIDLQKRLTQETYKRDLQKRPMCTKRDPYICVSHTWSDTFVRDVYEKRPTKKTYLNGKGPIHWSITHLI